MVEDLPLKPGDVVLDLGCGPGFWTLMLAEKIKPDGKIIGIDLTQEFLSYARKSLQNHPLNPSLTPQFKTPVKTVNYGYQKSPVALPSHNDD